MHPVICKIGPLTIYAYGLMLAVAVAVAIFLIRKEAQRQGLNPDKLSDFAFWSFLGGIIGGRVFYILLNLDYFLHNPAEMIMLHRGGLVWYGGLGLGIGIAWVYLKINRMPILKTLDLCAPYIALGQAIGRIGCFLNGCCFGKPVIWGVYFPVHNARLHPTQLYSTLNLLVIFIILRWAQKRSSIPGQIIFLYLLLAPLERFMVEFWRNDSPEFFLRLTIFQIASLIIIAVSIYANLYLYRRQRR